MNFLEILRIFPEPATWASKSIASVRLLGQVNAFRAGLNDVFPFNALKAALGSDVLFIMTILWWWLVVFVPNLLVYSHIFTLFPICVPFFLFGDVCSEERICFRKLCAKNVAAWELWSKIGIAITWQLGHPAWNCQTMIQEIWKSWQSMSSPNG